MPRDTVTRPPRLYVGPKGYYVIGRKGKKIRVLLGSKGQKIKPSTNVVQKVIVNNLSTTRRRRRGQKTQSSMDPFIRWSVAHMFARPSSIDREQLQAKTSAANDAKDPAIGVSNPLQVSAADVVAVKSSLPSVSDLSDQSDIQTPPPSSTTTANVEELERFTDALIKELDKMPDKDIAPYTPPKLRPRKGRGDSSKFPGLWDHEINKIMAAHPEFVGCVPSDGIPSITERYDNLPDKKRIAFIINTLSSKDERIDGHWCACLIDNRRDYSVEYYDPFAKEPPSHFAKHIKSLIDRMQPRTMLKYKVNRIKDQDDRSSMCGFHSIRFLQDRLRGVPFREVTGFDMSALSEPHVRRMAARYGFI